MSMPMDHDDINRIIECYFKGAYNANIEQLNTAFHPDAHICGNFNGHYVDWTLDQFTQRVIDAQSFKTDAYDKTIVSLKIDGDIAMAKAKVVAGANKFTDHISLIKVNGKWWIRHKAFTNSTDE